MSERDRRTSGAVCAAHNCIRSNREGAAMFSLPNPSLESLKDCVLLMLTKENCAKEGADENKLPENVRDKREIMRWLSKYAIVDQITKVPPFCYICLLFSCSFLMQHNQIQNGC